MANKCKTPLTPKYLNELTNYSKNGYTYQMYLDYFLDMAMNRFRYVNLPETVDERYLEYLLLFQGVAIFLDPVNETPETLGQHIYATQAVFTSPLNVYMNPTEFRSIGNNGWNIQRNTDNAVLMWDNRSRKPYIRNLMMFAQRISDIQNTIDTNMKNLKKPKILTGPIELESDMIEISRMIENNEHTFIGLKQLDDIKIEVLDLASDNQIQNLLETRQTEMNECLKLLGIESSNTDKRERLIQAEVDKSNSEVYMNRSRFLNARRQALYKINKMFGTDIQVVWNEDLESENYNYQHNVEKITSDDNTQSKGEE